MYSLISNETYNILTNKTMQLYSYEGKYFCNMIEITYCEYCEIINMRKGESINFK